MSYSLLQVEAVLRGCRITLKYELTADTDPRTGPRVSPMFAAFMAALEEPDLLPEGIVCSHEYAKSSESRLMREMLKGSDALAFADDAQPGLQLGLCYVFKEHPDQCDPVITDKDDASR